jgi:hypothetical protein
MMRKQFTAAFKGRVVQEILKEEKTLAALLSARLILSRKIAIPFSVSCRVLLR